MAEVNTGLIEFVSPSREASVAAGRVLGRALRTGDVVALDGDLGAGKTTLTAGIAEGIGCMVPVSSPTFVLAMEHPARAGGLSMRHMDLYRLEGKEDFVEAGLDEPSGLDIEVVEWAEIAGDALPSNRIQVTILLEGERCRRIRVHFGPPDGARRAADLAAGLRDIPGVVLYAPIPSGTNLRWQEE